MATTGPGSEAAARLRPAAESLHHRVIARLVVALLRFVSGAVPRWAAALPAQGQCVFYANHSSHLDAAVIWALLPTSLRARTRPVAAKDYWTRGPIRRFLASNVFRVVLVARGKDHAAAESAATARDLHRSLEDMIAALDAGSNLIIFPEGTRGSGQAIAPFKSGLYHLAKLRPDVPLVPVYLEDLNRILPKGEYLLVPLICNAHFGAPILIREGEPKPAFLERARHELEGLVHR